MQTVSGRTTAVRSSENRRALLRVVGGTATAALAVPAGGLAQESFLSKDPHPAWFAEWQRLVDWCDGPEPGARELRDCPEWHRCLAVEDLIATTPARTLAGALCQLRVSRYYTSASFPGDAADAAVENALATLERLAGEQAHV